MLLTISTEHTPATDLGYLLHKNPASVHTRDLPFGTAHVFYPEASEARCTAALLVCFDAVGTVRSRSNAHRQAIRGREARDERPRSARWPAVKRRRRLATSANASD